VLDKRKERKRKAAEEKGEQPPPEDKLLPPPKKARKDKSEGEEIKEKAWVRRAQAGSNATDNTERTKKLSAVLGSIF
jgi:chromatin remodeling complex protein RSC6